ncbi:MAG: thiamine-phosphate kinase [Terricaulis sp.]
MSAPADEFEIIRALFAPLATDPQARGLIDDVAVLAAREGLVVTTDAIIEGVHFLPDDPIDTVAKKALRVNFSDLVAKGARPVGVLLTLLWPNARPAAQIAGFARGLGEDLKLYEVALLGGDTCATPGPLTVSITAFGDPCGARTPSRADASIGEQVWVTGVIGEAYLGLMQLTSEPDILGAAPEDRVDHLAAQARLHYRVPQPPVALAPAIADFASASIDVSDGLIADAAKLAAASGVAIRIDADAVPLLGGEDYVARHGAAGLMRLLCGGDDYEALFTAAPESRGAILAAGRAAGINVTLIGDVEAGAGVRVIGADGRELAHEVGGHAHRLGA